MLRLLALGKTGSVLHATLLQWLLPVSTERLGLIAAKQIATHLRIVFPFLLVACAIYGVLGAGADSTTGQAEILLFIKN